MTNNLKYTNKEKHNRQRKFKEKWNKTSLSNKLLIVFTAVIAIANLIYAGFSLWQLSILHGQLTQMQNTSQLEQRAWIGLFDSMHNTIEPNKPATGKFVFKNTGKTPASIIATGYTAFIGPPNFDVETFANTKEESRWKTEEPAQRYLAPNASMSLEFSTNKKSQLTNEIVESVKSGEKQLYVIGCLTYCDIFGIEHQTKFCGIAIPNTNKMKVHYKYNYMD